MPRCPVCDTVCPPCQGQASPVDRCPTCSWDLSPYPPTFAGQIPDAFVQKEQERLAWARLIWARARSELAELRLLLQKSRELQALWQERAEKAEALNQIWPNQLGQLQTYLQSLDQGQTELLQSLPEALAKEIGPLKKRFTKLENTLGSAMFDPLLKQLLQRLPELKDCFRLTSSNGIDYRPLRDLLAGGHWREADQETFAQLLKLADQETIAEPDWVKRCPCEDLALINRLWVEYSEGHFGFSVQRQIWQSDPYKAFAEEVGWLVERDRQGTNAQGWLAYEYLTFDRSAPIGHLPAGWLMLKSSRPQRPPGSFDLSTTLGRFFQRWGHGFPAGIETLPALFIRLEVCDAIALERSA